MRGDSDTTASEVSAAEEQQKTPVAAPAEEPLSDVDLCADGQRWFDFWYSMNDAALTESQDTGRMRLTLDAVTLAQLERHVRDAEVIVATAGDPELASAGSRVATHYSEVVAGGEGSSVSSDQLMAGPDRDITDLCEVLQAESDLTE